VFTRGFINKISYLNNKILFPKKIVKPTERKPNPNIFNPVDPVYWALFWMNKSGKANASKEENRKRECEREMEETISEFSKSVGSFCNHLQSSCDALKQSIDRRPIPLGKHHPHLRLPPPFFFLQQFKQYIFFFSRFGFIYIYPVLKQKCSERKQRSQLTRIDVIWYRFFWGIIRSLQWSLQEQWESYSWYSRSSQELRLCSCWYFHFLLCLLFVFESLGNYEK